MSGAPGTAPALAPARDRKRWLQWPAPEAVMLAGLVALGAALRFATLGDRSFWVDEGFTLALARRDLGGAVQVWRHFEANPPLYPLLAWLWLKAFGEGEVAVRSLSAVVGTATIPLAYAVTARLATKRAGLIAALLVAVSALDVWFSQDARPYALVVLTAGLSFLAFLRAREHPSPRPLAWWGVASALALLSHYFAVYLVAAEALWLLAEHPLRRRATLAATALPAATFLALLPVALTQRSANGGVPFIGATSYVSRVAGLPAQYVVAFQPPAQVAVSVIAFLAIPVAAWLVLRRTGPDERPGAAVAAAVGMVALLGPLVVGLLPGLDFAYTRYTVSAFIPLLAVVAIGLGARRAGLPGAAALAWLVGFSVAIDLITADHSKFDHEDWRAAARALPPVPGKRLIVPTPDAGSLVLRVYVPGARPSPATSFTASEIDVVGLPPPYRQIGRAPRPPRSPSPPAPPGFALAVRRTAPTFTLLRYRASRPTSVSRGELAALDFARGGRAAVLVAPGVTGRPLVR
jgi:mannosyltransferase